MTTIDLDGLCHSMAMLPTTGVTIFEAVYEGDEVVDATVVFVSPLIQGKYGAHLVYDRTGMLFKDIFHESVEQGIWAYYKDVLQTRRPWNGRVHYSEQGASDYFDLELVPLGTDMVLGFHRSANEEVRAMEVALEMSRTLMNTIGMVFEATTGQE